MTKNWKTNARHPWLTSSCFFPRFFLVSFIIKKVYKQANQSNLRKTSLKNEKRFPKSKTSYPAVVGRGRVQSGHRFSVRFFYFDIFNCGPVPRLVIFCAFSSIRERGGRGTTQRTLFFSASLLQQMSHSHVPIKNSALRQSFFSFSALHDFLMFVHRLLLQTSVRVYCLYLAGSYK